MFEGLVGFLVLFLIAMLVVAFPKQGLKAIGLCLGVCLLATGVFFGVTSWQQQQAHAAYLEEYGPTIKLVAAFRGFLARGGSLSDLDTDDLETCLVTNQGYETTFVEEPLRLKESEGNAIRAELGRRQSLARQPAFSPAVPNPAIVFPEYREEPLTLGPSNRNWKPLYVNPKLVPTPAPVVKPTPAPTPKAAKPETLYTSN